MAFAGNANKQWHIETLELLEAPDDLQIIPNALAESYSWVQNKSRLFNAALKSIIYLGLKKILDLWDNTFSIDYLLRLHRAGFAFNVVNRNRTAEARHDIGKTGIKFKTANAINHVRAVFQTLFRNPGLTS